MVVDLENELLLITAANGKLAAAALQHIAPRWKRLRLQCSSSPSADRLRQQYPDADVVQADIQHEADCHKLLQDVTACLLITPSFHEHEDQIGMAMMSAAAAITDDGGPFKHLLFSSVLHPIITPMTNHRNKRDIEERLVTSSIGFTVVQPSHFMDNVPVKGLATQENPVHRAPFNPETKFSYTALYDYGQAVSNILSERDRHYFATYELVSTEKPLDYIEVMRIVSAEIRHEVEVRRVPAEDAATAYASSFSNRNEREKEAIRTGMERMFRFYDRCGLYGNPTVMRMLIGREPLSYRDWVRKQLE